MTTNLKTLVSKLNTTCRNAAERAASLCMGRGNYEVDLEHVFLALVQTERSDVTVLVKRAGISPAALERDLNDEIGRFKTGNTRTPVFSSRLPQLFEHAWLIASLESETTRIRSGHLLIALLTHPELEQLAVRGSRLYKKLPIDEIKHKLPELAVGSEEALQSVGFADAQSPTAESNSLDSDIAQQAAGGLSKTPALDQYTANLTQRARAGKIDPVIGREAEIRLVIDILSRRRQNNPILTGEAGVGKTAVAEGLALRIAEGDVPASLTNVALHVLDMGLLQAGASVKGEFENRLKNVIEEVKRSTHPIILFIDEAHTMIGAGGQAGQSDAANLLKPALARGELRTIAATTWSEYKKYFEKDAALARRFQVVKVEEPSEPTTCAMLRAMAPLMEAHFNVRVLDEAIIEAVRLSARYITGRQLPDKAISVLDTACARVALGQSATPARIEDDRKLLARLEAERFALQRERAGGSDHDKRLGEIESQCKSTEAHLAADESLWANERSLVERIAKLRKELEDASNTGKQLNPSRQAELAPLIAELQALQGEHPLVPMQVDGHVVAEIIAAWTGIPMGKMVKQDIETVLSLESILDQRVLGQAHAIKAIAERIRTVRAQLEDPSKPQGVFLFVGPSGVGKTETALALADALFGGEQNLITINLSEFQEAHSVSVLKGSPPGYVGYGEGGALTEAVRRRPYSVVLLDEIEKAHPDVLELFYQVFDKGVMDDSEGREIDFKNALIILTSNVGSHLITQACLNKGLDELPEVEALLEQLRPTLYKQFKPAFLGRLRVIPYYPIGDEILDSIIRLKLERLKQRIANNHHAKFEYDDSIVDAVFERCQDVDSGARLVDTIINGSLLPEVAAAVLARMAEGRPILKISAGIDGKGAFTFSLDGNPKPAKGPAATVGTIAEAEQLNRKTSPKAAAKAKQKSKVPSKT